MNAVDEERVMTRFLLGALDDGERERVLDRLTAEPSYFEQMAATEDDLILRSLHRQLSADDQALFDKAYLTSPARRARVEETRAVLEAAKAWKKWEVEGPWAKFRHWLSAPIQIRIPVFATVFVVAVSVTAYVTRNVVRQPGGGLQPAVLSVELTVEGSRREGTPTMDVVTVPSDKNTIQLWFRLDRAATGEPLEAELEGVDSRSIDRLSPPLMVDSVSGATAIVTLAARPDGDYVLRLRRTAGGGDVVATRAFRVRRSGSTGSGR